MPRKGMRGLSLYEKKQMVLRILKVYSGMNRSSILLFLNCMSKKNYVPLNEVLDKLIKEQKVIIVPLEPNRKGNIFYQINENEKRKSD